jgi:aldehyde dehydrogenase (NAD+)
MLLSDHALTRSAVLDETPERMFIDGRWVPAATERLRDSIDPSTGKVFARYPDGHQHDVDIAVRAARTALNGPWGRCKPYERQRLLLRIADALEAQLEKFAILESADMGAPLSRTRTTVLRAVQLFHWYAAQAVNINGRRIANSAPGSYITYTTKEPVGVVAAIIPWNSPTTAAAWKIGPALATGCTLVLKPAEEASLVPLCLAGLCADAGVPEGVLNVVTGSGEVVGARLAAHPGVDKVAFTGSRETGGKVAEAAAKSNLKRVTLELGGKSPNIVLADADLDSAVPGTAMASFHNSGQICSAGSRLFVQDAIYPEFLDRLCDFTAGLRMGDPLDETTQLGPLVSAVQMSTVTSHIAAARQEGASSVGDAPRPRGDAFANGYFVSPTVFTDVRDDMRLAREEVFGPVLAVMPFRDVEEALIRANATDYGLGSGLWTNDLSRAHRLAESLQAGTVWVNCYQQMDPAVPFGGYKQSGYGRESGLEQIEEYLNTKAVWMRVA